MYTGMLPCLVPSLQLCKFVSRSDLVLDADPCLGYFIYLVLEACISFRSVSEKVAHLCFCLVRIKCRCSCGGFLVEICLSDLPKNNRLKFRHRKLHHVLHCKNSLWEHPRLKKVMFVPDYIQDFEVARFVCRPGRTSHKFYASHISLAGHGGYRRWA